MGNGIAPQRAHKLPFCIVISNSFKSFIGILFVIISGFSRFFSHNKKLNLYDLELFAIGTGLIVDEYIFIVFTSGAHSDYFSSLSVIGTIIITGFFAIIFYSIYKLELHKKTKEKTK